MLIQDIVRRVREVAGDTAVLQFSNATVTDWINDAVRRCVEENTLLQAKAAANLVIGQRSYTLPEDIFKIHSALVDSERLELVTLKEWEDLIQAWDLTSVGVPSHACIYAGKIDLYPLPQSVGILTINYSKNPKEVKYINDGTNEGYSPNQPEIPASYHTRIVTYCLAQVALQDDDYPKYQAMMSEFTTGVVDLNHLKNQTEAHYPYMTYVEWE